MSGCKAKAPHFQAHVMKITKSTEPVQPSGNTQQGGTKHGDPDNEHQQPGFVDSLSNLDAGEWYVGHVERSIYEDDNEMLPPPECQKLHWAALHVEVIRRCCTKPGVRFSISVRISISTHEQTNLRLCEPRATFSTRYSAPLSSLTAVQPGQFSFLGFSFLKLSIRLFTCQVRS